MTSNTFTRRLRAVVTLTALVACASAWSQDKVTLKLADHLPLTHPASKLISQALKAEVESLSKGSIEVQHFPAEQLAKGAGLLDAARNRVTDIAFVPIAYVTDKLPLSSVAELPGMYVDAVAGARALTKLAAGELLEREYLKLGVRPLFASMTPNNQLMLTKKGPIDDLDEVKGLKIRVSGSTQELAAQSLGLVPVRIGAPDTYLAVERGTVDGLIFNGQSAFSYKIERLLASTTTNAPLGTVAFVMVINAGVWDGLSPAQRDVLVQASAKVGPAATAAFQKAAEASYAKLAEVGVKTYEMSPKLQAQVGERLKATEQEWIKQLKSRGLPAEETLAAFRSHLQ